MASPRALGVALRGRPAVLLVAVSLTVAGPVLFLTTYPAVLANRLALGAGLILAAQVPASLGTQAWYGMAGSHATRHGHARGLAWATGLRLVALAGLVVTIQWAGRDGLAALFVWHALLGVGFAFLQVNGPCLAAHQHPVSRADGVGAFHVAVGMGTLGGALLATLLAALASLASSYAVAVLLTFAGWALVGRATATGK